MSKLMGSAASMQLEGLLHGVPRLSKILTALLSFHSLSHFCLAIPDGIPSHLLTDNCTAANAEYYSEQPPGSFFFYIGTRDTYCDSQSSLSTPSIGWKICGLSSAPACTTAIAPYGSKSDACSNVGYYGCAKTGTTFCSSTNCRSSVRVFFINFDLDCDWLIVCEYFDGAVVAVGTGTTSAPSVLAPPAAAKNTTSAPSLTVRLAPPALAPAPLLAPSPSLLPKLGDVVVLSSYAVGRVDYACNKASGFFSDGIISANLYASPLGNASLGTYVKANGSQLFRMTDGSVAVIGLNNSGNSYAQNPNLLLDGGYGSLNQSYTTAAGNLSLANVTYVTITATVGGILPSKAPCTRALPSLISYSPWSIPFEANITFFSIFTPPV